MPGFTFDILIKIFHTLTFLHLIENISFILCARYARSSSCTMHVCRENHIIFVMGMKKRPKHIKTKNQQMIDQRCYQTVSINHIFTHLIKPNRRRRLFVAGQRSTTITMLMMIIIVHTNHTRPTHNSVMMSSFCSTFERASIHYSDATIERKTAITSSKQFS